MIARIARRLRQRRAKRKLEAMRKPDMAYWQRRLAQLSPERRMRQLMSAAVFSPELWR